MRRLSFIALALAVAGAVYFAGRAWNARVDDWTVDPPLVWRGVDGPGFTLACPAGFRVAMGTRSGEPAVTLRPPGSETTSLRVYSFAPSPWPWAGAPSLRSFVSRQLGIRQAGLAATVRIGPSVGRAEWGTLPSGRLWKAAALEAAASAEVPDSGRTLIVLYEQVPSTQAHLFDRVVGSLRPRGGSAVED